MSNLKIKIGITAVAVLLLASLAIVAGFKEGVNVQQAYGMTITNQQLAQAHLISSIATTTTTTIPQSQANPYTSHTII
jgi:K+ transporter